MPETLSATGAPTGDIGRLVDRYVLIDVYAWSTPIAGRVDRREYHVARRGELVSVSAEEAARGEGLGALSSDADDLAAAEAAAIEPPSWSDVELDSANAEDTIAYLVQHPTEANRVAEAEASRPDRKLKARKTVLEAAERVQSAHEEQLAADTEARLEAEEREQAAYAASQGASSPAPRIP